MAKILNLDKLAGTSDREMSIAGVSHKILPMTVENFIETSRNVDKIAEEGAGLAEQLEATISMILRSVPSLSRDVIAGFELSTLNTIATFVRGEDVPEQEVEGETGK